MSGTLIPVECATALFAAMDDMVIRGPLVAIRSVSCIAECCFIRGVDITGEFATKREAAQLRSAMGFAITNTAPESQQ